MEMIELKGREFLMCNIGTEMNMEDELNRQIEAEGKTLSWSVLIMHIQEGNFLETTGSVYYSGFKFFEADQAFQFLKKWELLSDYSIEHQERIIEQINLFVKSGLKNTSGYGFSYGYKASAECYRETEKEIKISFIDDSDTLYFDAIIDKRSGIVSFEYLGVYCQQQFSKPFEDKSLKVTL
ncbi:hypothetical protein [Bacillus atrophaeus]|uniref:hypothetical protein n=2 Tax=Bacillus atrophaeus TaxID=1452 RepID=UPI002E2474FB|nr:hypothetical protein [Bacillus atrophaeus]MED1032522.1 hypothetical protein [Bacillus atrophaeus]